MIKFTKGKNPVIAEDILVGTLNLQISTPLKGDEAIAKEQIKTQIEHYIYNDLICESELLRWKAQRIAHKLYLMDNEHNIPTEYLEAINEILEVK